MPEVGKKVGTATSVRQPPAYQVAINLFDIGRIDPAVRDLLLGGKLNLDSAVWVDKTRPDETAVVFTCDTLEAACLCDVIRDHFRKSGESVPRVYVGRNGSWSRVPYAECLTRVAPEREGVYREGEVVLSPTLFPSKAVPIASVPLREVKASAPVKRNLIRRGFNGETGK